MWLPEGPATKTNHSNHVHQTTGQWAFAYYELTALLNLIYLLKSAGDWRHIANTAHESATLDLECP